MRLAVVLALKDLRLLAREPAALFWVLAFPLLMAILFGSIYGGGDESAGAMKVAVVDEDGTDGSRAFVAELRKSDALEITPLPRAKAVEAVRRGRQIAYVALAKGYGASPFGALGGGGGDAALLEVGIDPSRRAEAGYLRGILMEASFGSLRGLLSDPAKAREPVRRSLESIRGASGLAPAQRDALEGFLGSLDGFLGKVDPEVYRQGPAVGEPKVNVVAVGAAGSHPRSAYEITFPQAILWGLLGCVSSFAISLVTERVSGTLLRLRLSPLSRAGILGGKALACLAASAGVTGLLLLVGRLLFGVRLSNPAGLAAAAACSAIAFTGIMMLVSTLGKSQSSVAGAGWAILLVFSMIGGGMVPLFVMPAWMRAVASFSPVKWAILSFEGAIWRGFSAAEMAPACGILLAVGLASFTLGAWRLARADD